MEGSRFITASFLIPKYAGKDAGDFYGKKKEGYRRV